MNDSATRPDQDDKGPEPEPEAKAARKRLEEVPPPGTYPLHEGP